MNVSKLNEWYSFFIAKNKTRNVWRVYWTEEPEKKTHKWEEYIHCATWYMTLYVEKTMKHKRNENV